MSWQDDAEAISATVSVTNAFSTEALADAGTGTSLSAPSSSVINLDGKVLRLLVAGTGTTLILKTGAGTTINQVRGLGGVVCAEFLMVWDSASGNLVAYCSDFEEEVNNSAAVSIGSSQSNLSFTVSGITVSQFVLKLA